jgi:predicted kinase
VIERPQALILTGPPGAGKTTVAKLLAARYERAVHLESDRFFRFIETGFIAPWRSESHAQNVAVMGIVGEAAARYVRAGYFTIVDGILTPDWFLEPIRDALTSAGVTVSLAILRPSLDVAVARARDRAAEPLREPDAIAQLWQGFADLGELERHVIDNEGISAEETTEALVEKLALEEIQVTG